MSRDDVAQSPRSDEFLAMLAHELRNPLESLRMACELMRSGRLDTQRLGVVQELIARQVEQMARLVDDLLDTARINHGKLSVLTAAVELRPLVGSAVQSAGSFSDPRRQRIEFAACMQPLWVRGDTVRITQIVTNLLHNAAKFSADGASIHVTLERDNRDAVIRVKDHGKGIDAELLPRVFDLFMQGGATGDREKTGLGLGLAIVRDLAAMHGGHVSAASDGPGKGSEFVVRLPLIRPPRETCAGQPEPEAEAMPRRRILVVDDNRDAAESMRMVLETFGHAVETAGSGQEAIALAEKYAPDCVLVDIGLPDIDGFEVARRLRQKGPCRLAMLAAITGYGGAEDRQRSADAGFDCHLVKPVVPNELLRLLARPVSGASSGRVGG